MPRKLDPKLERSVGTKVFLAFLAGIGALYSALFAYDALSPSSAARNRETGLLEQCRLLCEQYGLIPTGDTRRDADAYLEATGTRKLTAELSGILGDRTFEPVATQPHVLLGEAAPDFALCDVSDAKRSLTEWTARGPVVLVFYYGYGCSHCVAQLFAIDRDLEHFRELEAEVIALSSDAPAHTRDKYREYGAFRFPVLSDPKNRVAETYGIAAGQRLDHGTFVIDASGRVVWAYQGPTPFLDNKTLLRVLADHAERARSG